MKTITSPLSLLQSGATTLLLVLCVSCSFAIESTEKSAQLRILLTNDDGYDAVGIRALTASLRDAGHDVTVIAPHTERSGSGAAVTFSPIRYEKVAPQDWRIDATPATCVFVGLRLFMEEPPDLIVSGINIGHNIGASAPFSGTVGATIAGIYAQLAGVGHPIPSVAFSADYPESTLPETSDAFRSHYDEVAAFATDLIAALVQDGKLGLAEGMALNVNYPGLPAHEVRGIVTTRQGRALDFQLGYDLVDAEGTAQIMPTLVDLPATTTEAPGSDTKPFLAGFITITPLDGNYGADAWLETNTRRNLENLR